MRISTNQEAQTDISASVQKRTSQLRSVLKQLINQQSVKTNNLTN